MKLIVKSLELIRIHLHSTSMIYFFISLKHGRRTIDYAYRKVRCLSTNFHLKMKLFVITIFK